MSKAIKTLAITTVIAGSAFGAAIIFATIAPTPALAQYAGYSEVDNAPYYNGPNEADWRCNCTGRSQQVRAF